MKHFSEYETTEFVCLLEAQPFYERKNIRRCSDSSFQYWDLQLLAELFLSVSRPNLRFQGPPILVPNEFLPLFLR